MQNNFTVAERNMITKTVLKARNCQSSSEFVFATYDIYSLMYPAYAIHIEPILDIEVNNEIVDDWVGNTCFSQSYISLAEDRDTLSKITTGYRTVLDFLINDEAAFVCYRMDDNDKTGWKIWKELDRKYKFAREKLNKMSIV